MMNPFIASLMQQAEQASKDALAQQGQGSNMLGMAMMGLMGGQGGGGLFGGSGPSVGGDVPPLSPTLAAYSPMGDVGGYTPPAPSYSPPPMSGAPRVPPIVPKAPGPDINGFTTPGPSVPPIAPISAVEPKADVTAAAALAPVQTMNPVEEKLRMNSPLPTAADVAANVLAEAPPMAPVMPEGATPLAADFTASLALNPVEVPPIAPFAETAPQMTGEDFLRYSGRDLGMTPEQYRAEGVAMPDWGYTRAVDVPSIAPYTLSETGWNGTQAIVDAAAGGLSRMTRAGAGDAMSALLAGPYMEAQQRFGAPIPILDALAKEGTSRERETPGSRHFHGDALDIDISGFDNEQRLALLDALTASGFTDFGLGAGSLHADTRGSGGNWSYGGGYGGLSYGDAVARLNQGRQAYRSGSVPAVPPLAPQTGFELAGGDASAYPGQLPGWLSPAQPTETMMTKAQPGGSFDTLLPLVLAHEGGYSNHWADNGGATNRGVTTARYDQYRRDQGLPTQDVRKITDQEVNDIYRRYYFDEVRGGELPAGVDYAMFDFAVNSGPGRAINFVQEILGLPVDGKLGPETMAAIQAADPAGLASALNNKRLSWLQGLSDWQHFGKGWGNRVNDVMAASADFAAGGAGGAGVFPNQAAPDDNWRSPYNNRNMAIFGGVTPSGGLYHDWNSGHRWAHDNSYGDYSQMYREFTFEPKDGYVPVGERDGRTVYAAPGPEYIDGNQVSREGYWTEARNRGALIPTESEMRALYEQAQPVVMPTIPNGGGPNDRISFDNVPDGPWYGPKEFYRTNDSPALPLPANLAEAMAQDPKVAQLMHEILMGGF